MIATRYFNRYNVMIRKGKLDEETNRWLYILQVDRFDDNNELDKTKEYYIVGNKNEDTKMQSVYVTLIEMWLSNLKFMEVEKIFFMFPNGYKFKMAEPSLVSA